MKPEKVFIDYEIIWLVVLVLLFLFPVEAMQLTLETIDYVRRYILP